MADPGRPSAASRCAGCGLTDDGQLDLSNLDELLDGAKAFALLGHVERARHASRPVRLLTDAAHEHGAIAVVDACQYVPHVATDVQAMGADFIAFSAHKMCGPSGIGVRVGPRGAAWRRCRRSSAAAT